MPEKWTASELGDVLDLSGSGPFLRRLRDALRGAIHRGALPAGSRLPSSRELAVHLGRSRRQVVEVYEQLSAEGYLLSRAGSGTCVAPLAASEVEVDAQAGSPAVDVRLPRYDLRPGIPDLQSFPAADWAWALGRAAREAGRDSLGYGQAMGHPALIEQLTHYLRRTRGALVHRDGLAIVTGFQQGLALAAATLAHHGIDSIAVEDPGDRASDQAIAAAGLHVIPIPVDREGLIVEKVRKSGVRAVLCTPSHQTPTGAVLSAARRTALTEWAEDCRGWIIEDDYDAEFRHKHAPIGSVQGLIPARTLLVGSVSKTHAPALRLGWVVAPSSLAYLIRKHKEATDRGTSVMMQLAFAYLLDSGRHDRHVRGMRRTYRQRRKVLESALESAGLHARLRGEAAGFHALLELDSRSDERRTLKWAAQRGIALRGLADYYVGVPDTHGLVIGFGNASPRDITRMVAGIARVVSLGTPVADGAAAAGRPDGS